MQAIIHDYIEHHKNEMLKTLKELIKIPSYRGEPEENAPFGRACKDILDFTKALYEKNGFGTQIDYESGYLLSCYGNGDKNLGLFAHADVVAPGENWILTNPFNPIEKDGFLIGRGTIDDKSAIVMSLYIAKMLKELKIPFNSRLVCFTGANEETGMEDIKNYLKKHTPPDFSLVVDTAFPLYIGNKGVVRAMAKLKAPLSCFKDFSGGDAPNAMLGRATAVLEFSENLYSYLKKNESENISVSKNDDEIIITAIGIVTHAAIPEGSVNAGYLIADMLKDCEYIQENDRKQLNFMSDLLKGYYGEALGIEHFDPNFGKLTFVNGIVRMDNKCLTLSLNIRYGSTVNIDEVLCTIKDKMGKMKWEVDVTSITPAHLTQKDNPYIQKCLNVFTEYSKWENAPLRINAGGTYAQRLPVAAEIGPRYNEPKNPFNLPSGHGNVHEPDEMLYIDSFYKATEIAALMLLECDKEDIK